MEITNTKLLCFFVALFFSVDAFSQLKVPTWDGGIIGGGDPTCEPTTTGSVEYCTPYSFPAENLTFDYTNPIDGCYPVNNLGCDLHIGLTYEGNGSTSYVQITSCLAEQIIEAEECYEVYPNTPCDHPWICITIPIVDKFFNCKTGLFEFSLDLYCKDEFGNYTSVSDMAMNDFDNIWWTHFPDNGTPKNVIQGISWETGICCDDSALQPVTGGPEDALPLIGQNEDGSRAFVRNLVDMNSGSISVYNGNNQSVNISNRIEAIADDAYAIDLSNLESGVYFVRVVQGAEVYSKTIIRM